MAALHQEQVYSPWQARGRQRASEFEPRPVKTSIPGLKTVEESIQEQVKHCNEAIQADMDFLHEQVITEVHGAVSQELHAVAQRLAQIRGEIGQDCEMLRQTIGMLQKEVGWIKSMREQDKKEIDASTEKLGQIEDKVSKELQQSADRLQEEVEGLETRLQEEIADVLASKLEEECAAREEQHQQLGKRLDEAVAGLEQRMATMKQDLMGLQGEQQELQESEKKKSGHHSQQLQEAMEQDRANMERALAELAEGVRSEAMVGEVRFRESQAMVADLEQRLQGSLGEALAGQADKSEEKELRVKYEIETLREGVSADIRERLHTMDKKLQQMNNECREEINFAHTSWARQMEWNAGVDLEQLEREGKLEVSSPVFMAAGLRPLRMQLRLARDGKSRWACGVYLRAPHGKVTFKVSIASRSQSFTAEFGETSEWGSGKIVVLDVVPPTLKVNLEILDVVAPLSAGSSGSELSATLQMTDAAQIATREVANLRSTMVRRVEWRISRVSERIAAAREAALTMHDGEALEPLISPQFAAAGFEGLQLQLYPLGYRPRGDEACGFFITCPKGVYMKCKAFVGDNVRNFEHHFDTREPYGRGSFCRLADKADGDDCIVVGVEFIEVRQEQTTQVRGGPFGNVADQLKLVNNPSVNGMEIVRELREVCQPEKGDKRHQQGRDRKTTKARGGNMQDASATMRGSFQDSTMRATSMMSSTFSPSLQESKSLPSLLPAMPLGGTFSGSFGMSPNKTAMPLSSTKQMDTLKCR